MSQFDEYIAQFVLTLKERGAAENTQKNYVVGLLRFFNVVGKAPPEVSQDDIRHYQVSLFDQGLAPKTINLYMASVRSFYLETLKTGWPVDFLARVKERRKLPVLLSPDEMADLINATENLKTRTLLLTMYSAGLRPFEAVSLKYENIDSRRMLLHAEVAKGGKNRFLSLSETLLQALRFYWITTPDYKWTWLAIPTLQSREALASYFRLSVKKVSEVLDVLITMGVVNHELGRYTIGPTRVRLGNDSFNIIKHHSNWRGQAIDSFDRQEASDLHYSGVLCLSVKDAQRIKDLIFECLKQHLEISDSSPEEELFAYCIDFFNLRK